MSDKIRNDLIEAYKGFYENEIHQEFPYTLAPPPGTAYDQYREQFEKEWAIKKIKNDRPKERLEVYLTWNGIIGYSNRIWEISQGGM